MGTSMNRRVGGQLRAVVLVSLLAAVGCGERLQEYVSEEGRFRVQTPSPLYELSNEGLPDSVHKVGLEQRNGSLSVAWEDLPKRADRTADDILDLACNGAVDRLKGKVAHRGTITLNKTHPGRELLIEWANKRAVVLDRLYLVNGRLYHVMASGPRWWVESPPASRFLDSFEVIEE